jgi:hypothetical protein
VLGRRMFAAGAVLGLAGVLYLAPATAQAATPSVSIVTTTTAMTSTTTFTAANAIATCPDGTTLVGGGDELTTGPTVPVSNNGTVTLGVNPSNGSGTPVSNGTTDPSAWTATGGYSGQAPGTSAVTSYAMCASNITSATQAVVATSGAGSLGPVTAECPVDTSLVGGGGGYTSFITGDNTKIYDSFPSDAAGDLPSNGSAGPTAWTVEGNSNTATGAVTTAVALCATDVSVSTEVATGSTSLSSPVGGASVTATATCPVGDVLLDGGSDVTNTPSGPGTGGQGVHLIGDVPSDSSGNPTTSTAGSWTVTAQNGGQGLTSLNTESLALCETAAPSPTAQAITFPAAAPGVVGTSATLAATGGGSGNPVTFTVDPASGAGVCSVSGTDGATVSYAAVGSCVIDANQAGNVTFTAAPQVNQTIAVTATTPPPLTPQSIAFTLAAPGVVGGSATLTATGGGSGNPVTFTVDPASGPGVCSVSGTDGATVSYTAAGSCVIDANQAGNATFSAAPQTAQVIAVTGPATTGPGYNLVSASGSVFSFNTSSFGSVSGPLTAPIVGMASTPDGKGYYLVAADGGVFAFGDAVFHGSAGNLKLNQPIVGMAVDPTTGGYWLVASDGGVFAYDAPFFGSEGGQQLNQPIVGMASTPDGNGYYFVAADGGIFAYGDAAFHGSTGNLRLNKPVVGMAVDAATGGYWLVATDGGIFAFDAAFQGSAGGEPLQQPVVGMAATTDSNGYYLVATDGGIFNYGDAAFEGSEGGQQLDAPIVGMSVPTAAQG